jgi:hypothetical protein
MIEQSATSFISGSAQLSDGRRITDDEVEAFMDLFLELVEAQGYGFGGSYGLEPVPSEA